MTLGSEDCARHSYPVILQIRRSRFAEEGLGIRGPIFFLFAQVVQDDAYAPVEEREFAQTPLQDILAINGGDKDRAIGQK